MKLFIILAAITLAKAAKLDRTYLPPNAQSSAGSNFLETPRQSNGFQDQTGAFSNNGLSGQNAYAQNGGYSGFETRPERVQAAFERNAAILRQDNSNDGETYAYAYETENGIYGEENGVATNGVQAQGGYSYTGDDGKIYSVRYTADENGFQPQGDHLPTSPPIPEEILKALEQNARDEAAGIFDDGTYNEGKYDNNAQQQYYNNNDAAGSGSSVAGIQKAYLPPVVAQRNDASGSGSSAAAVQKAYLPPFAQRNNQRNALRQPTFNNNALSRNDAAGSASSLAGVQKAYLPPVFAQRNDASGSGSPIATVQKAYLPPFAQRSNQRSTVRHPTFNSNALPRNDATGSGISVAEVQKVYLPPVAQRRPSSFDARDGYHY